MGKGGNDKPDDRYFGLCDVCVQISASVFKSQPHHMWFI